MWECKYCIFGSAKRGELLKHYRLKLGGHTKTVPFPCLHNDCLCTSNTISTLKVHLAKIHTRLGQDQTKAPLTFTCQHCEFSEPGPEADFLKHLCSRHLSKNEKIQCPYKLCKFQSSVYATFNAHISKKQWWEWERRTRTDFLGTSRGEHKICAVFWVLANIPVKHRSMLRSIRLGLLCNAGTVKECEYEKVMQPLVKDHVHLEQTVKGTVLHVSADNLGVHSMAGFLEVLLQRDSAVFAWEQKQVQHTEVGSSNAETRTKDTHERWNRILLWVNCMEWKEAVHLLMLYSIFMQSLAPDILHGLVENIVTTELSLPFRDD